MFKIIILSQIGADRYQKLIFKILLLSPPWRTVAWSDLADRTQRKFHSYGSTTTMYTTTTTILL